MPLLVNHQLIDQDAWEVLPDKHPIPDTGHILIPFSRLAELETGKKSAELKLGAKISGGDDIHKVIAVADQLSLVVINIPAFTDGRGFSFARMLRRAGFTDEIRASGDVTRDRLAFLQRCGFNAFDIPDDRYTPAQEKAFIEISVRYQGAADDPKPIYRQP